MIRSLVIGGVASGVGKTTVTLGLLAALHAARALVDYSLGRTHA